MRKAHYAILFVAMVISLATHGEATNTKGAPAMSTTKQNTTGLKIRFVMNGKAVHATLADNPTARDFYSLLPLALTLSDYAATEKIADLPRKLSIDGAPPGVTPVVGDIAYYAPWGNLAIYHKNFHYSEGLIKLGTIDAGLEALTAAGPVKVRIKRMDD